MAANTRLFVGNIAWGTTEDDLQELFSRVGEARFDLHREKGTSKSSGYGFVDFKDSQTAELALKKFAGYEINGRELNVDFPSQSNKQAGSTGSTSITASKGSAFAHGRVQSIVRQAPMRAAPGSTSQKVNSVMDSMSSAEIYDILISLKEDPEAGKRHLQTNPSLAYALLQSQVILGYISLEKAPSYFIGYEDTSNSSAMAVDSNPSSAPSHAPSQPSKPLAMPTQQPSYTQPPVVHQPMQPAAQPPIQGGGAGTMPPLRDLVRMHAAQVEQYDVPPQFKTLINIVHTWSQRPADYEALPVEQQTKIKRIFEEAQVPLPNARR